MAYNYSKLKGRIIELYGSQENFAKVLGLTSISVSRKLKCRTEFSQSDIEKWAELLNIKREEYLDFFYTNL